MRYDHVEDLSLYIDIMDVILSVFGKQQTDGKYSDGEERRKHNALIKIALSVSVYRRKLASTN